MRFWRRAATVSGLLAVLALIGGVTTACGTTTPEAMCAFVVGNGLNGNDTKLHRPVLPGENIGDPSGEVVRYVPCNPRNYIINNGSVVDATGKKVGDRLTPTLAYTKERTPVQVWSTSYWMLNLDEATLRKFYEHCYKFGCYSETPEAGVVNYSTPGWNGMLGEDFGPTLDEIANKAMASFSDDIWRNHDAELRDQLGEKMSELFAAEMRAKLGFAEDLFCGSGNSGFKPNGGFECTKVRIEIPRVDRYVPTADEAASNPAAQAQLNAERLNSAEALYGPSAGDWLGVQDSIKACQDAQVPCQVILGDIPQVPAS